jgi:hypothetical protein
MALKMLGKSILNWYKETNCHYYLSNIAKEYSDLKKDVQIKVRRILHNWNNKQSNFDEKEI